MSIGIIGAGTVGGALARSWVKAGHRAEFGVREPGDAKHRGLLDAGAGDATAGTNADAGAFGEVLVLATPWDPTQAALSACGGFDHKGLVDGTSPLRFSPDAGRELALDLALVPPMGTGFTWAILE